MTMTTTPRPRFDRADGPDKVTGSGRYTADLTLTGLSYAEVADVLGCSIAAVKVLIHRARMSFRAHYTETSQ